MKIINRLAVLVFLFGVLFASCQKESLNTKKTPPSLKKLSCSYSNNANPGEEEGEEHNRIVGDILTDLPLTPTFNEIYSASDSIAEIEGMGSSYSTESSITSVGNALTTDGSLDIAKFTQDMTGTSLEKELTKDLMNIVVEYDGTNGCTIISDIKSFESGVSNQYSEEQVLRVLKGASVARHSLAYWDEHDLPGEDMIESAPKWLGPLVDVGAFFACGSCAPFVSSAAVVLYDLFL